MRKNCILKTGTDDEPRIVNNAPATVFCKVSSVPRMVLGCLAEFLVRRLASLFGFWTLTSDNFGSVFQYLVELFGIDALEKFRRG
eukprot:1186226-Pyramimonas_sp.AAC.1